MKIKHSPETILTFSAMKTLALFRPSYGTNVCRQISATFTIVS